MTRMDMVREPPCDAAPIERPLAQNLQEEARAWRAARARRFSVTASGVPVLRRTQRSHRATPTRN
jgi:hypothetical protein